MRLKGGEWQAMEELMRVVQLTAPLRILVPALVVPALPVRTRGFSYERGWFGITVGGILVAGSLALGLASYPLAGLAGIGAFLWLFGGAGIVMIVNGIHPIAFVKPICVKCRLLPIIKEHEAIHLAGVVSDSQVWEEMRIRHSCESLNLDGDPNVCSFCPIPRRLREQ